MIDSTWRVLTGIFPSPMSSMGARGAPGASLNSSLATLRTMHQPPHKLRECPGCSGWDSKYDTIPSPHETKADSSAHLFTARFLAAPRSTSPPRCRRPTDPASTCAPQPRQTDLQPGQFEHAGQVAPPAVLEILAGSVGGPNNSGDI